MRWRSKRVFALIVALAVTSAQNTGWASTPAEAEREKRAGVAFSDAQAAFDRGDYRRAGEGFESAYALKRHYASLWNAAQSWQRAGDDLRAVILLDQYLREAPPD